MKTLTRCLLVAVGMALVLVLPVTGCGSGNCKSDCAGKLCGQDDSCGGKCLACQDTSKTCNTTTWTCTSGGCTNGQTQCSGNEVQTCSNGAWQNTTDCSARGKTCSNGACTSCSPSCTGQNNCGVSDGCGGKCTACPQGQTCNTTTWQCQAASCTPPTAGSWFYGEYSFSTNTCNSTNGIGEGDGTYAISSVTSTSFVVTPGDGGSAFTCTLDCNHFTCHRAMVGADLRPTYDAVLTGSADVDATMSSASSMTGTQTGTVSCAGTACAAAAAYLGTTFPCSFSIHFTGSWQHS